MTPGTTRERPTTTNSSWFTSLLVPLYAFGIALLLTLGAGSLVASTEDVPLEENEAGSLSSQLARAQSDLTAARARVSSLETELAQGQGQGSAPVAESQAQGAHAQDGNPRQQPTQPSGLIVRIVTAGGAPTLDPEARKSVVTQWLRDGDSLNSQAGVPDNGIVQVPPTERPDVVCVDPTRKWTISQAQGLRAGDPTVQEKILRQGNRNIKRIMCVDVEPTQSEVTFTLGIAQ